MGSTREPLVTNGSIIAIITAVLALVVAFGVDLTTDQQVAILGVTATVVPVVLALVTRGQVTPVASPQNDDGVPLTPDYGPGLSRDTGHDRGIAVIPLILVVLAVIGALALLGYGVGG